MTETGPAPDGRPDSPPVKEKRPGARALRTVLLALLLGAAALWGSSRLAWTAQLRDEGVRGQILTAVPGADHVPALVPYALVALAAIAGVLASRGAPRRLLGAVVVVAGLLPGFEAVRTSVRDGLADGAPVAEILAGRGLGLAGGLLIVLGGIVTVVAGARMPGMGGKYAAPGTKKAAPDPEKGMWDALSEGRDPTRGR
ncbi:hypothetical protein CFN78_25260 [Amycolatopsis antarctica]|uniref:TIGR02234 family membrane protein n=1 Tax=Amycolatopsis antarctica TaxID=1854586 RepID=A0A263CWK3_9PSEU|nr:Trp biosynthesis-associated membrane protein [Amycolatopsis antarctica]OZM70471.1 hypothetical protein CFN78_25260 [Amycolatopsis antarctica]